MLSGCCDYVVQLAGIGILTHSGEILFSLKVSSLSVYRVIGINAVERCCLETISNKAVNKQILLLRGQAASFDEESKFMLF